MADKTVRQRRDGWTEFVIERQREMESEARVKDKERQGERMKEEKR